MLSRSRVLEGPHHYREGGSAEQQVLVLQAVPTAAAAPMSSAGAAPPEAPCRKQKPTMKAWPDRYAKIEPPALNFYNKKGEPPHKKRGSSIPDVRGCHVRLGLEKFTFDGTQFLITLERRGHSSLPDLDDGGVSQFCFKKEAERNRFAVALQNMAAGRAWDEPASLAGRATVSSRGPAAADLDSPEAGAEQPQVDENGGQAELRGIAGSFRDRKNPLLCILVNNTKQLLTRVAMFEDSGEWLEPPPGAIGAFSTVAWASAGAPGLMGVGTTGTSGAVAFRGANVDVVVAFSRPLLGEDRVGGGVFRAGFVTQAKLSRKATVGHDSSRCSYDRLLRLHATMPASAGVHVAWHSPTDGGAHSSAAGGALPGHPRLGVPFIVYVVSDQPPQIENLLQPILARAQRSMLVRVENHAWVRLEKRADKADSGMWKTEAPDVIPPESTVIFASESMGAGTDAHVTYAMSIATGGVTAEALVTLRWVNPLMNTGAKGDFARGKYVDITTEFSCSPGLVVEFDGPSQVDNSTVTFVVSTEAGAQPGRFHPEKGSVKRGRALGRPQAGRAEPRSPRVIIPPPMLELPPRREPKSGVAAQLTSRAAKAKRSMVVYIDNKTPFSFRQHDRGTLSGAWTQDGEPPTRIEANELVVAVSESTGLGTEAFVKYRAELSTGQGDAHASFELRWVNPKVASAQRGRYVETKTDFDCNPGLVLQTTGGGPTQAEPSCVRFVIEMKDNAQPIHYNPSKYRSTQSAAAAFSATPSQQGVSSREQAAGASRARAASQPVDQNSDMDVMWRRKLPLVDMWECMEECPVRCGPHAASREFGVLPKGSRVRIVEEAWVRTDASWIPILALRLVGSGCCTQNAEGAVTELDATLQPTFSVEKDNLVAADHGSQIVLRRYKKGEKFIGVRKLSTSHAVLVAQECWVSKWSIETGLPYMLRRRATHPPFESNDLQHYLKRSVEVDAGQKMTKPLLHVDRGSIIYTQLWPGDQPHQPVKAQITAQPPSLVTREVTFREAMSIVDCFPIKTFNADDWPVHKLKRGDVVRQYVGPDSRGIWRDDDRRWKIAHSTCRNPTRPYWSLQPRDDPDSDMYLRTIPSQLGFDQTTKVAIGEFTAAETGRLTLELDNSQTHLSEAFLRKTVTFEVVVYTPALDEDKRSSKLDRTRSNTTSSAATSGAGSAVPRTPSARQSRRHRTSRLHSVRKGSQDAGAARTSPHEQLVSQLRKAIATGQADPVLIAEQFCTEQPTEIAGEGRVTVDGICRALSSYCIEFQPQELQDTLRFFGFQDQDQEPTKSDSGASGSISKTDFLAKVLPPPAQMEQSFSDARANGDLPLTSESSAEPDIEDGTNSGAGEGSIGSTGELAVRAVDKYGWLVVRCPYRVCPIKAQWSTVTGAVAPGKAGVAWGAVIGAGVGAITTGGLATGLGAAIGASIGGYVGLGVREGDLDAVYYSICFRERTVIRSYADFKQLARLCRKANIPSLPQPPGATESTLRATSLMEGQCVLARQLDIWLHAVARELIINSDKLTNRGGPTPIFLGFLGVLFRSDTDGHGQDAPAITSSSSSDDEEDDDGSPRQDKQRQANEALEDDEDAGAPKEVVQGVGSPWKMVRGAEACRSRDPHNTAVPFPTPLRSYFVAAVEWRVNYAFQVSQIPGLKTGAHSVTVVTLRNGDGGEHMLLVDAVTEKVRLRLIPRSRLGEWRHASDPGTAVLFKRAELSTQFHSSEGGVFCEPVRSASELWEQAREGSKTYDAGKKNCHHFARDMWNWCVVPQLRSTEMPTDMLAQDLLMVASQVTATAKAGGAGAA